MPEPSESSRGVAPTLTLFCGLPGSGKTTLARRLERDGHGVRICTDEWRSRLCVSAQDAAFHERLQRVLYRHALTLLASGVDVILEDGLWQRSERAEKVGDARARGARVVLHVFEVPVEQLWARLQQRNAASGGDPLSLDYPMTLDELHWAATVFEPPTADELALVDVACHHSGGRHSGERHWGERHSGAR